MVDRRAYRQAFCSAGWAWILATAWPVFNLVTLPYAIDALPDNRDGGQTLLTLLWVAHLLVLGLLLRRADRLARARLRAVPHQVSSGRLGPAGAVSPVRSVNDL